MPHKNKPTSGAMKKAKANMKLTPSPRKGRRPTLGNKVPRRRKGY